jgi:hypothetical protein
MMFSRKQQKQIKGGFKDTIKFIEASKKLIQTSRSQHLESCVKESSFFFHVDIVIGMTQTT